MDVEKSKLPECQQRDFKTRFPKVANLWCGSGAARGPAETKSPSVEAGVFGEGRLKFSKNSQVPVNFGGPGSL